MSDAAAEIYNKEFKFFENYQHSPDYSQDENDPSHSNILYKYLKDAPKNEPIDNLFKQFYDFFYKRAYEYDINGYNLIFFNPAQFSAFQGDWNNAALLNNFFRDLIVMAVDYNPHEISVSKTSIELTSSLNFSYPTDTNHSGDISITYLDTDDLRIYSYHSLWLKYIFYANMGYLTPNASYIENNTIDYFASIYSLKFKQDMKTPTLATKAMGVFPNSLPSKETIGTRGEHQLTLTTINYSMLYYTDEMVNIKTFNDTKSATPDSEINPIYQEILSLFDVTEF